MATEKLISYLDDRVEVTRQRLERAGDQLVLERKRIQQENPVLRQALRIISFVSGGRTYYEEAQLRTATRNFENAASEASFWKDQ